MSNPTKFETPEARIEWIRQNMGSMGIDAYPHVQFLLEQLEAGQENSRELCRLLNEETGGRTFMGEPAIVETNQPTIELDGVTVELDDLAHRLRNPPTNYCFTADAQVAADLIERFLIPAPQFDLSKVIRLTAEKTRHIVARDGLSITGFVLTHPGGGKCVVDQSAVRWFSDGMDFFHLMHGDDDANASVGQSQADAMLNWLQEQAELGCVTMCFELDGGVHVTLDPVGEEQRAARYMNTIRDGIARLMTSAPATITHPRGSLGETIEDTEGDAE